MKGPLFLLGFALGSLGGLGAALAQESPETLPPQFKIVKFEANPTSLQLDHRYDYRQLVLTGYTESGERLDVTRLVRTTAPDLVKISSNGLVTPVRDGSGQATFVLGDKSLSVPVHVQNATAPRPVSFIDDVMPILGKLGCNAGTCHGAQMGRNGFQLTLRGYDPLFDHQALTDDLAGRRFNRSAPEQSLMLQKPSGGVPHQGGVLTKEGERHYAVLRDWIAQGVTFDPAAPRVESITLFPQDPQLPLPGMKQQMQVWAKYTDGSQRDVTAEAFVTSSLNEIVEIDAKGLARAVRRGEAAVLARYEGAYAATTILVMGDRSGYEWQPVPENNFIDALVYEKLKRVKILPSDVCSDADFLRRVSLDLLGLPPLPEEIRAFLADPRSSQEKRNAKIDELIGSEAFVEHWTSKWCDLLQVNRKYMGEKGTWAFRNWIRQAVASNMPYDEFVRTVLTAQGSTFENPPASYFQVLRNPNDGVETTTQLFLGVRFNCNKCHDHPFERWTQTQYYEFSAFFAQIGRKAGPNALMQPKLTRNSPGAPRYDEELIYDTGAGEVTHLRTNVVTPPTFPYQGELAPTGDSRRERLAQWLTSAENQYFATSYVNRLWSYMLGVGIIDPVDDIRAGNPPSNPQLLKKLSEEFVSSKFDTQHMLRLICKSRVYQQSIASNKWNEDDQLNYSHAYPRRLSAEVLIDTIHRATGAEIRYAGMPAGFRAAQLPDSTIEAKGGFLDLFGRPPRESPCECERGTGVMLSQALNLVNGPTIADAIAAPNNRIAKLVATEQNDAKVVDELFIAILCRPASPREIEVGISAIREGDDRLKGAQDLAWALLNSPAFLFNR